MDMDNLNMWAFKTPSPTPTDEATSPSGETDMPPLNLNRQEIYEPDPTRDGLTGDQKADIKGPTTPEAQDSDDKRAFNQKRKREEEGVGFAVMTRKSPAGPRESPADGPRASPTDGPPTPAYNALSPAYRFSGEPIDIPPLCL
jgi:hypothetical protein